ncbi:hypothetical protein [Tropicibacter oceani]|uniref:Uncharacterized protein n=1 Tax=Tropicibacter oceani TaxID=3058420 RepID=A0ABY8QIU3_9RHOB|nr:hypothetical protein [Tropicibacter oceani]WGW03908.1 hypothetical protein QF118_18635 [Tropicibacter oceani]
MSGDPLKFQSPEELEKLLGALSLRLHYINRVAAGESTFHWWYAELLAAVAQLAPLLDDKEIRQDFGDGWTAGRDPDPRARLLALIEQGLPTR